MPAHAVHGGMPVPGEGPGNGFADAAVPPMNSAAVNRLDRPLTVWTCPSDDTSSAHRTATAARGPRLTSAGRGPVDLLTGDRDIELVCSRPAATRWPGRSARPSGRGSTVSTGKWGGGAGATRVADSLLAAQRPGSPSATGPPWVPSRRPSASCGPAFGRHATDTDSMGHRVPRAYRLGSRREKDATSPAPTEPAMPCGRLPRPPTSRDGVPAAQDGLSQRAIPGPPAPTSAEGSISSRSTVIFVVFSCFR